MIFNLSTLELDNGSQLLFFAGSWIVNSAKEKHELATTKQNWLQIGYNFEMYKKEKSRKSLTYRTLSYALQDGLVLELAFQSVAEKEPRPRMLVKALKTKIGSS